MRTCLLLAVVILVLPSCLASKKSTPPSSRSRADPCHDAASAIARGDFRYLIMNDIGTFVPGLDSNADQDLAEQHGTKAFTDVTDGSDEKELRRARNYAEIYNRLITRHLLKLTDE